MPTLLHTSDLHVSARDDRGLRALSRVVDVARSERVDAVVIAGDLFDNHRVDAAACEVVAAELERMGRPVVILPGNHDPLDVPGVWQRTALAANVSLMDGGTVRIPELGIAFWGRPHLTYEDDLSPLVDVPARGAERWEVAIAHGHFVRGSLDLHRSYLIRADEIANCGRDYVALGHWDIHQSVGDGVPAYYPGSPTTTGVSSLVTLDDVGVRVTPVSVGPRTAWVGPSTAW